ncbi:MAG: tRNA lysidine(34) synthetase TilS, partial [Casimicrobiaceae bacterium]
LSRARAANLLRWFLRRHALCAPSERRLAAMIETLAGPARPASLRIVHDGMELGIHRGRILVHDPPVARYALPWDGRPRVSLAHGELAFTSATGDGVAAAWLDRAQVSIRSGVPGEHLQRRSGHPRHLVSDLLREAGVPAWERAYLPRIYCGDALAAVPMAGVDAAFAAAPGMPGTRIEWQPSKPARMLEL